MIIDAPIALKSELVNQVDTSFKAQKERVKNVPVALINVPSGFLLEDRSLPPLGILRVAGELAQNGNRVDVVDTTGYSNYLDIVDFYTQNTDVRVFGLTATTPQLPAAVNMARRIRENVPDAKIILGGPHTTVTFAASELERKNGTEGRAREAQGRLEDGFDTLVAGDGEKSVFYAIDSANRSRTIDATTSKSDLYLPDGTLEQHALSDRSLIDLDSYRFFVGGHRAFSVIAQLGCPFSCGFCCGRDVQTFRNARTRSADSVIKEIEEVVIGSFERGNPMTGVMFYDDELNVVPMGLENLCRELVSMRQRLGQRVASSELVTPEGLLRMQFRGFVKADLFKAEQAHLMKKAGFGEVMSGVESGSDQILDMMRKRTTRVINTQAASFAHEAGLRFKALMSVGHPGESERTIAESVSWVLENRPEEVDWTVITTYPGSHYYDRAVPKDGAWVYEPHPGYELWSTDVDYTTTTNFYKGVPGEYQSYVWTNHLSSTRLVELRDEAEDRTRRELGLKKWADMPKVQLHYNPGTPLHPGILRSSSIQN